MTGDIRKLITAAPFTPFTIHLADGNRLRVPTVDHIAVSPSDARIIFTETKYFTQKIDRSFG